MLFLELLTYYHWKENIWKMNDEKTEIDDPMEEAEILAQELKLLMEEENDQGTLEAIHEMIVKAQSKTVKNSVRKRGLNGRNSLIL